MYLIQCKPEMGTVCLAIHEINLICSCVHLISLGVVCYQIRVDVVEMDVDEDSYEGRMVAQEMEKTHTSFLLLLHRNEKQIGG